MHIVIDKELNIGFQICKTIKGKKLQKEYFETRATHCKNSRFIIELLCQVLFNIIIDNQKSNA